MDFNDLGKIILNLADYLKYTNLPFHSYQPCVYNYESFSLSKFCMVCVDCCANMYCLCFYHLAYLDPVSYLSKNWNESFALMRWVSLTEMLWVFLYIHV